MTDEIKPGDKLYYVPSGNRNSKPSWVTVQKVGRKWITLPHQMRCDKETLVVDCGDYTSPGRCYRDVEKYAADRYLRTVADSVYRWFDVGFGNNPRRLTLEQCVQIAAIAGIQLPEREAVTPEVP